MYRLKVPPTFAYLLDNADGLNGLVWDKLSRPLSVRGQIRGVLRLVVAGGACHQQGVGPTPEVVVGLRLGREEGKRMGRMEGEWREKEGRGRVGRR